MFFSENVHFVRCVRSNTDRTSSKFDAEVVGRQMKALSIQESYRMSVLGYSHKLSLNLFIKSYRCLLPIEVISHEDPQKVAEDIFNAQGTKYLGDYAIGSHSVFLKNRLLKQLEDAKYALRDSAATLIQRNLRKFAAKKDFEKKKTAAIKIQSAFRGWNARLVHIEIQKCSVDHHPSRKKAISIKYEEQKQIEERIDTPKLDISKSVKVHEHDAERVAPSAPVQWYDLPEEINTVLNQEAVKMPKVKTTTNYLPLKLETDIPQVEALTIEEFAELNLKVLYQQFLVP